MTKTKTVRKYQRHGPVKEAEYPADDEAARLFENRLLRKAVRRGDFEELPTQVEIWRLAEQLREARSTSEGPVGCQLPPEPYEIPRVSLTAITHHVPGPDTVRDARDYGEQDE